MVIPHQLLFGIVKIIQLIVRILNKWSKKVSSKFEVYEFRVSQLVIACLLFLNMTSQLSMVKSLYLYSSKYGGWSCDLEFHWKLKIWSSLFFDLNKFSISINFYIDNQDTNIHLYSNGSLEILKVEIIDNDRYHCTATNPAGTINRYIQLNVNSID